MKLFWVKCHLLYKCILVHCTQWFFSLLLYVKSVTDYFKHIIDSTWADHNFNRINVLIIVNYPASVQMAAAGTKQMWGVRRLSCRGVVHLSPHTLQCETFLWNDSARRATATNPLRVKELGEITGASSAPYWTCCLAKPPASRVSAAILHALSSVCCHLEWDGGDSELLQTASDSRLSKRWTLTTPPITSWTVIASCWHCLMPKRTWHFLHASSVFLPLFLHVFWFTLAVHELFIELLFMSSQCLPVPISMFLLQYYIRVVHLILPLKRCA